MTEHLHIPELRAEEMRYVVNCPHRTTTGSRSGTATPKAAQLTFGMVAPMHEREVRRGCRRLDQPRRGLRLV